MKKRFEIGAAIGLVLAIGLAVPAYGFRGNTYSHGPRYTDEDRDGVCDRIQGSKAYGQSIKKKSNDSGWFCPRYDGKGYWMKKGAMGWMIRDRGFIDHNGNGVCDRIE